MLILNWNWETILTLNYINISRGGDVFGGAEVTAPVAILIHGKRYLRLMSAKQAETSILTSQQL